MTINPFLILLKYRYWLLFPLACIEGPVVAIAAGFLLSLGHLSTVPTFILLFFGDFVPDMTYFWLGHLTHRRESLKRHGRRIGLTPDRLAAIERLWHRHTFNVALFSKWAYGLSTPLLMSAGVAKLPLKRFLPPVTIIIITQYALLMIVGYFFGSSYTILSEVISYAGWIVAAGIITFIVLYFLFLRFAKGVFFRQL